MSSAHYTNMPLQVKTLDFRDTFLSWDHLQAGFPDKVVRKMVMELTIETCPCKTISARISTAVCPHVQIVGKEETEETHKIGDGHR